MSEEAQQRAAWGDGDGGDTGPAVMPGHPVEEGAGYDCACGECLALQGSYLGEDVPPQPDECRCEGKPRHIHHPWGWRGLAP